MKVSFTSESIKHQMVLLLFTVCFQITDAENAVELVKYQELKTEINVSFTMKVTAYKWSQIYVSWYVILTRIVLEWTFRKQMKTGVSGYTTTQLQIPYI